MKIAGALLGLFTGLLVAVWLAYGNAAERDAEEYQAGKEAHIYGISSESNPWVGTDGSLADAWLDGWTMDHKMRPAMTVRHASGRLMYEQEQK